MREVREMTWRVALVDDEAVQLDLLQKMLSEYGEEHGVFLSFETFASAEAFLFHFEEDKAFDLLVLDIEMGDMNGMDLARQLRKQNHDIKLLFVTGYTDYIGQGYEVSAMDYILKPVKKEKLFAVIDRFRKTLPEKKTYLLLDTAEGMKRIQNADILYLEASRHQTLVVAKGETMETSQAFGYFEDILPSAEFIKIHRSYLVNLAHIARIGKQGIVLDDESTLPISRRRYKDVNQAFIAYYKKELE
jgi:DNA-binding LytR/AlgR family response regulator